jgi:triacylglycerol esterase/lipase EstA (alpha/beta hydrolase family)
LIWDGKTKYFGLNDSKYSPNLIYSWFHHECHSDLLVSPRVFEFCHIFKRFISHPYILVLS